MRQVLRTLPLAALALHIALSTAINADGLRCILADREDSENSWTARLSQYPVVGTYAHYTGLLSGYGFFAPRVGSSCYLEIGLRNNGIPSSQTIDAASLFHAAGYIRFRSFQHVFYELLPETDGGSDASATRQRIAQATVIAIGRRIAHYHDAELMFCRLFVYDHPSLKHQGNPKRGRLIELYSQDFTNE